MFSSPADSKVTHEGLALEWNGHSTTFWTLTFELLGGKIRPVYFKNERVTGTALRASWFWPTLARFPGKWGRFSGTWRSKITPDYRGLHWNGESKTFWTLPFEASEPKYSPLYFNTEKVAETALRLSWSWPTLAQFPGKWGIFSGTGDSKVTPDCLGLHLNGERKTFWTLPFEASEAKYSPTSL